MIGKPLAQLYAEHEGKVSDKWSLYLEEYDRIFGSSREKPVKMLEIGVQNGGSLEIWSKYFPNGEKFIGCDINPECSRLRYDESRIAVVIGDANTDDVQAEILKHSPEFDIVIDDGSHVSGDIVKSFARYFPNIIDGGVFVAEDLHCSYWKDFEGGLFHPFSAITFFKHLTDVINHEHWGVPKNSSELLTGFFEKYGFKLDEDTLEQVHSIEFVNSICIVRKCAIQSNVLGSRFMAGDREEVEGLDKVRGKPLEAPSQSHNFWSSRKLPPSEELPLRLEELGKRSEQIGHLNQVVAEREGQIGHLNQVVAEREGQIGHLNQVVAEREGQIGHLNQVVAEREGQIGHLNQVVAEREGQIGHLNQVVAERENALQQVFASTSWRVTRPIRAIKSLFIRNGNSGVKRQRGSKNTKKYFSGRFDAEWYLEQNPDVAMSGMEPYEHYVSCGKVEGRLPAPDHFFVRNVKRSKLLRIVLPLALKRSGGIRQGMSKVWYVFKREGLEGLKRRAIVLYSEVTNPACQSLSSDRNDYTEWIRRYDTLTDEARAEMRAKTHAFVHKPLISVIMPTYNTRPEWLEQVIESVRRQIYPNWELCIADDASTDKVIRPILQRYAKEDARIKVVFREHNGHISVASNSALELASGEWVALLDHDDLLAEHALYWVANAINQYPEARLIYSDEDKIDDTGMRFSPYFKCGWNEDLFYSHNMITHLGVYRSDLLREIGGFREGLEGAQDYDLALRFIEDIDATQICHIPRVLYHWRMHADSTAQSSDAKPYALVAGAKALSDHFCRQEVNARVEPLDFGMYRVRYDLPESLPMASLIIPTRNGLQLIRQCVESVINKTTYSNYEILIVDNGSDDPAILQYFKEIQSDPRIRVVRDERPFNYSALNNAAVKSALGEIVVLLNNDIEVISPDWLSEMVSHALRPGVGAVGARLWYPNGTLQHGGAILGIGGVAGHSHKFLSRHQRGYFGRACLTQGLSTITAACLVIRKAIYEEVGGLNETDLQVAFNDVDFCLRIREAGYRNLWTPYAELYHHESASRGLEDTPEKQARFAREVEYMKKRWGEQLLNDPAYSPNLTLDHEDFSLAWPPRVELVSPSHQDTRKTVLNRVDKAFVMIDRKGLGLEIGPSHNPLAPKKQGFNVHVLDHVSAGELREKYKGHGVNLENIEEVDYVWHGEPLHELIGREQCYDWIIASHIIEHTPDLISFLTECERLLKPSGVLSLIIPDKRYCFDYFNAPTSTGEVLDAFEQKRARPSPGKVFDHFAGAATRDGQIAWGRGAIGAINLVHDFDEARSHWTRARASSEYIDVHNWRFTPDSFRLVLADLQALGLTKMGVAKGFDTEGCEFFITLHKTFDSVLPGRLELLNRFGANV